MADIPTSTVVLLTVTLIAAISVALWLANIPANYSAPEQLNLVLVVGKNVERSGRSVSINITVRNVGTRPVTINMVSLRPHYNVIEATCGAVQITEGTLLESGCTIEPHSNMDFSLIIDNTPPGQTLEIIFYSSEGTAYPVLVKVP